MKGQLAEAARAAERLAIARARMAEERASLEASEQEAAKLEREGVNRDTGSHKFQI